MENNIATYEEDIRSEEPTAGETRVKFNQGVLEFKVRATDYQSMISIGRIKEFLYQEAILNLIKKSKFLQLYIQLAEGQIDEDEYEKELKENPDRYFINIKEVNSEIDWKALILILRNLPSDLSVDEVSEIFGIKSQSFLESLNQ